MAKEDRSAGGAQQGGEEIPLGQRLFDNPFLLLAAGLVIMLVFFTGWGLVELALLTPSPLP